MPVILTVLLLLLPAIPLATLAEDSTPVTECEIIIDDLTDGMSSGWKRKSFKGITDYNWTREGDKPLSGRQAKGLHQDSIIKLSMIPGNIHISPGNGKWTISLSQVMLNRNQGMITGPGSMLYFLHFFSGTPRQ